MKKLFPIALAILGLTLAPVASVAQGTPTQNTPTTDSIVVSKAVTIEDLSEKFDKFAQAQQETNEKLERKINNANNRLQDVQDNSSWRWFMRDLVPIMIMTLIGVFLVAIVYVLSMSRFRTNQLKYDTILKCTERTGSVPDFFNKVEKRRAASVPVAGRVHLVLSIICGMVGTIFVIAGINQHRLLTSVICIGTGLVFAAFAVKLFMQFTTISENSRKEE